MKTNIDNPAAAAAVAFCGCAVRKTADQNIVAGAAADLTFGGETFDTDSFHDNSTNPDRITVPAGKGGYYLVTGKLFIYDSDGADPSVYGRVTLTVGGVAVADSAALAYIVSTASGESEICLSFSQIIALNAGDILRVRYSNQSTNANTVMGTASSDNSAVQVAKIG